MKKIFLLCILIITILCGCESNNDLISYIEAKEKIINNDAILLDVRTEEEYNENHIEGAVLLPVDNINEETAKSVIIEANKEVIVYCKSGIRSKQAKEKLNELGFNNVYDLGSIDNWKN